MGPNFIDQQRCLSTTSTKALHRALRPPRSPTLVTLVMTENQIKLRMYTNETLTTMSAIHATARGGGERRVHKSRGEHQWFSVMMI